MSLLTMDNSGSLGNLAFYHGPSYQYVYFKSLLTNQGRPEYIAEANRIGREGASLYSSLDGSNNVLESRIEDYSAKLTSLLEFLQTAVTYERDNEVKYFRQQLDKLIATFNEEDRKNIPMISQLERMFESATSGSFDYRSFLALINSLMSGIDNARSTAKYEQRRIADIENRINELKKARASQLVGLAKKQGLDFDDMMAMIEDSIEEFDSEIDNYVIKYKNLHDQYDKNGQKVASLRGAEKIMKGLDSTVDVALSNWINQEVITIFKSKRTMNHIIKYCQQNNIISSQNYDALGTEVLAIVTLIVQEHALKHFDEVINHQYEHIDKKVLLDELMNAANNVKHYRIEGVFKNNYGVYRNRVKAFEDAEKDLEMEERHSEGMLGAFERLRNAVKNATAKKIKLNRDQSALYNYMKEEKIYNDFDAFSRLIGNLERYSEQITKAEKMLKRNPAIKSEILAKLSKKSLGKNSKGESIMFEFTVTANNKIEITNLDSIKQLQSFKNVFGDDAHITLSTLKNSLGNLRRQGSKRLRDRYAAAIDKATKELESSQKEKEKTRLNNIIRKGLEDVHVSVSGPTLAEILAAIDFDKSGNLVVNAYGKANAKNDVITISIDTGSMELTADISDLIDRRNETYAELINKNLSSNEIENQFQADLIMQFQSSVANLMKEQSNKSHRYKNVAKGMLNRYTSLKENKILLEREENQLIREWNKYKADLEKNNVAPEEIKKKYKDFLESIKNSIYVSTTVKTYNHYRNHIGFTGGSIGGDLQTQLGNIFDMFELAGVPISLKDQEWLLGAIINSSPATILGESIKHSIENYLGSMAAFMLFDEGGAEAKIIDDLRSKTSQGLADSNPSILHLYRVNGLYVCGSYVLQEVYNQISKCAAEVTLALQPNYKGASVRIINNISESDIPNRGEGRKRFTGEWNQDPWGTVGKTALSKVSIEIYFLAGLLDIAEGLESALTTVQLPS